MLVIADTLDHDSVTVAPSQPTLRAMFLPATWGVATKAVLAAEFERETGIRVEIDLIARDAIHDHMGTLFAAKDASYDIFNIDYNWVPEFAEAGQQLAIDDAIDDTHAFLPKALEVARYQGTLFSLPQTVHPHLLWYRKDLFDEAGLRPPTTMDAWRTAAQSLHDQELGGRNVAGWGAQAVRGYGNVHTWLTFLYSFGGDTFSDYWSLQSTLDTPEALAATEFWADMMRYTPPNIDDYSYDEVITAAASGAIATCLHGSWGAFAVDDPAISSTVGKWDFVKVPAGQASVPHLAEWMLAVSNYSQQHDAAIAFIRYLESAENDVRQALLGGGDPVRSASYADPRLTQARVAGHPDLYRFRRYPQVLEAMQTAKPRPLFAHEEQWETVVSTSLYTIQRGHSSVRDALAKAQRDVEQMIKEAGYR
jgi:ABC-type glycerol-3-phosphate transport system substrate-binding protein